MRTYQEIIDILKQHEQNNVGATALSNVALFEEQATFNKYGTEKCSLMYLAVENGAMMVKTQHFNAAGMPITRDEYFA